MCVQCPSYREALQFADRFRREGVPTVHRWRYLLVGAVDEDSARALAEGLRRVAPPGSVVAAEGTREPLPVGLQPNPFAIPGGLGGWTNTLPSSSAPS
jgi:hypothetical protein